MMITSGTMSLDPHLVEKIFLDCLHKKGEDVGSRVEVEGVNSVATFHQERLAGHRDEIEALLSELPDDFKKSVGGGLSFLSACLDRHGNQWTGLHMRMGQLFQLGLGIGKVECPFPREMWRALPGGMPYYAII